MTEIKFWTNSWSTDKPDIPDEYERFGSGNPYLTRKVKALCKEHGVPVFVEMRKGRQYSRVLGYHAPLDVVAEVRRHAIDTAEERKRKTAKVYRDGREEIYRERFAAEIMVLYPSIPDGVP